MTMATRKIISKHQIGHLIVTFKSDLHHRDLLDTEVYVGEDLLCVISGCYISMFIDEFKELIQKYRI